MSANVSVHNWRKAELRNMEIILIIHCVSIQGIFNAFIRSCIIWLHPIMKILRTSYLQLGQLFKSHRKGMLSLKIGFSRLDGKFWIYWNFKFKTSSKIHKVLTDFFVINRSKQCKKELWAQINTALQNNSKWQRLDSINSETPSTNNTATTAQSMQFSF